MMKNVVIDVEKNSLGVHTLHWSIFEQHNRLSNNYSCPCNSDYSENGDDDHIDSSRNSFPENRS